jgi:N-acetylglutamate synthase-like GNAT family acetyltransferase
MKISLWKDTEDEKQEILDLTKKTFGDVEITNPSYFDWQYRNNPDGKALVLLFRDDSNNQIIGTNTIIPLKLIVDGEIITSSLACNVQVHPDYRKKKIFSKLLLSMPKFAIVNGIHSLFAIPNDNSFKAFINEGSIEITQLPLLIKPIKFSQYFGFPIKQILKPFDIFWKKRNTLFHNVEQFNDIFDDSFENLAKKTSKRISVMNSRKKEFLNWRYKNHPTRKYQIFTLKDNNDLIGYIITKIHYLGKKKIGVILDYMVDANFEDKTQQKSLIDKAISNFWDNGISIAIATSRNGLLENELLRSSGFFTPPSFLKPESLHFIVNTFSDDKKHIKLKKFDNWFFVFGDYDVF